MAKEERVTVMRPEIDLGEVRMELTLIPAGEFTMGGDDGDDYEMSPHRVQITWPFYMGVTEVTQAQYEAVMGTNPSKFKGKDNPVETVSWEDAMAFCRRLSQTSGMRVRLPSEAEWEYACRAGTTTAYYFGDSDDQLIDYAWYISNAAGRTHPVGQKRPNAWGLYDMHGNVLEWCQDWYFQSPEEGPTGPPTGSYRVVRGGHWLDTATSCRSANRNRCLSLDRFKYIGFRVCVCCL